MTRDIYKVMFFIPFHTVLCLGKMKVIPELIREFNSNQWNFVTKGEKIWSQKKCCIKWNYCVSYFFL